MSPQFQDFFLDTIYMHSDRTYLKLFPVKKKFSYFVYILFCILQAGSAVTSHGAPLIDAEAGMPFPHPLPLLSYLFENFLSKSSDQQSLL